MQLWVAFISLVVRLAVWLKVHFHSILWRPQPEETRCVLAEVDGSTTHHDEDQLVQGTVVVDASELTSLSSHDAPDFGLESILSAISQDEELQLRVSYESSGGVDKPRPNWRRIWKSIVKSVTKDRNLCIDIYRFSEASQSTVVLVFSEDLVVAEEISVMFMEKFANAINANPRIGRVRIQALFGPEPDRTFVTQNPQR